MGCAVGDAEKIPHTLVNGITLSGTQCGNSNRKALSSSSGAVENKPAGLVSTVRPVTQGRKRLDPQLPRREGILQTSSVFAPPS
jgi:hypothetical protein